MLLTDALQQAKLFTYLFETMPWSNLFSVITAKEEMPDLHAVQNLNELWEEHKIKLYLI